VIEHRTVRQNNERTNDRCQTASQARRMDWLLIMMTKTEDAKLNTTKTVFPNKCRKGTAFWMKWSSRAKQKVRMFGLNAKRVVKTIGAIRRLTFFVQDVHVPNERESHGCRAVVATNRQTNKRIHFERRRGYQKF
jgi:hypothetical protein